VVWTQFHSKAHTEKLVSDPTQLRPAMMGRGFLLARRPIPSSLKLLGKLRRGGRFKERLNRTEPHGSVSWGEHDKYLPARRWCDLRMESYPKFHNEIGVPMVRIGCQEASASGISRRKISSDASHEEREEVIRKYERHLVDSGLINDIHQLCGKDLVCWCAPLPCHGDVLLRLANP
jgi:hypothetical protein